MESQEILIVTKNKMRKSFDSFTQKLLTLRTGQASVQQFEHIQVMCYGTVQHLNQISNVSIPETRQVLIKPWDVSLLPAIEKAIMHANMSVNPHNDGKVLRITIPPLTDQTREESIKKACELAEEVKVSIRNVRRDANEKFKKLKSNGEISEDDMKHHEKDIQIMTDDAIREIEHVLVKKKQTIREI